MLGWPITQPQRLAPFAPRPVQALRHYYGAICPCAPHRYSGACSATAPRRSLGIGTTGSHVPYKSLCCGHAASMPDATQPVTRYPLDSSRAAYPSRFRHRLEVCFDTSSAVHLRSSPQHPPDAYPAPFPLTLTTTALNGSSSKAVWRLRLDAASEGPTLISCTAFAPTFKPLDAFVAHVRPNRRKCCHPRSRSAAMVFRSSAYRRCGKRSAHSAGSVASAQHSGVGRHDDRCGSCI